MDEVIEAPPSLTRSVTHRVVSARDRARESLREDPHWLVHRQEAGELRLTILELAETADALACARDAALRHDARDLLRQKEIGAYVYRVLAYSNDVGEAMVLAVSRAERNQVRGLLVRALEWWQSKPSALMLAELRTPQIAASFSRLVESWDRSGRGVVRRFGVRVAG